jgi:hypothetical protein
MSNVWTYWRGRAEVTAALRELCQPDGCGPGCERAHVAVWYDDQRHPHILCDEVCPPPLASELRQLYPRQVGEHNAAAWTVPDEWNEPLVRAHALVP